jgi:UDP-N-acetylglucosamine 2-epimerase (non-hydrolysing)/GDP/UDP-N,N'-diacetylbacillosamine 2-epimerase (hydrolysing)
VSRAELEKEIGLSFEDPIALVTYHPVTLDREDVDVQIRRMTAAIKSAGIKAIFTMANADSDGARINSYVRAMCARWPGQFKWIPHLGHRRYLGCLRHCSLMVGNSSSGLTEAPSFRLPVVNVGDRQRGRIKARNVIDVRCAQGDIVRGIKKACSKRFRNWLRGMRNPYDRYWDGRASERIKDVLKRTDLSSDLLKKQFHDLKWLSNAK